MFARFWHQEATEAGTLISDRLEVLSLEDVIEPLTMISEQAELLNRRA